MLKSLSCAIVLASVSIAGFARAATIGTYGDVTPAGGGGVQLKSDVVAGPGYAGVYIEPSLPLTLAQIVQLSVNYQMTQGSIGGGSPRFSIGDMLNKEAYVYFGTPQGGGSFTDPNTGSTGNYADLLSSDARVAVNGFGGVSTPNTYETWGQFVAGQGATQVGYVTVDLDGGFIATQTMLLDSFRVNDTVAFAPAAVPLPSSVAGGLVLLSCLGVARFVRSRRRVTV